MLKFDVVRVTPLQQNCSLLWCDETNKGVVVDPGGDPELIEQAIAQHGISIVAILVTHGHFDHAGAVGVLAKRLGVPVEGPHEGDAYLIQTLPAQPALFGFPMPTPERFTPARWLGDGDTVRFGNQTLEVIHVPGHTPGHIVFVSQSEKLAIVGDVLFAGTVGRTDHWGGDHDQLIASIKSKLLPIGDDFSFLPGHGPMSTIGRERRMNPYVSSGDR